MKQRHTKEDCDCPYSREPKHVGRAHWVCPECGRDVSIEYVLLYEMKKFNHDK